MPEEVHFLHRKGLVDPIQLQSLNKNQDLDILSFYTQQRENGLIIRHFGGGNNFKGDFVVFHKFERREDFNSKQGKESEILMEKVWYSVLLWKRKDVDFLKVVEVMRGSQFKCKEEGTGVLAIISQGALAFNDVCF